MNDLRTAVRFDADLIQKYDVAGPRYTSYPAAPHFRPDFGDADTRALLRASRESGRPLSLYVHVPFCAKRCFFCGCNVLISRDHTWGKRYLPWIEREAAMAAELLGGKERPTTQVHWGGGTPTFLPPEDLRELMAILRRHFAFTADCEIGVEVDPRACAPEQLDALAESGVNRLSLGVQDCDPTVQKAVNRVQPEEVTRAVLDGARQRGMTSLNIDLIYGLPYQTPEGFARTVEEVVGLGPDRLAVFNFAYLPNNFKHQTVIDPATLPSPQAKLRLLGETMAALERAGYVFIGMDHFARPDDPLAVALAEGTLTRNFQGYSTHADAELLALGVSSISAIGGGYAQNHRELREYSAAIEAGRFPTCRGLVMSADDHLRQRVILDIMCHFRLDKREIEKRFAIDFDAYFADALLALEPLAADGLVTLGRDTLTVTALGRMLVRNIAMPFDAYLGAAPQVRYSRTV